MYQKLFHSAIGKNVLANTGKVFVIFIHQILLVPLYIVYWGTDKYSDWIILSAVSSFFSMSDLGLNNVTNNQFCIQYAKGKYDECKSLLINNYILLLGVGGISLIILVAVCYFFNLKTILGLVVVSRFEASYISFILVLKIFLDLTGFVPDAIFNANSLASKATNVNTALRLSFSLIILAGILCGLSIVWIVTLAIIPSFIVILYKIHKTNQLFPVRFNRSLDIVLLKKIIKPSLAYMSFPIGFSLLYQGFTLLVNKFFGSETLVQFNTTRTMVNFVRNMADIVIVGVKPEFSIAYGKKDLKRMKMIYNKTLWASLAITFLCCGILFFGGRAIFEIWTRGKVPFSMPLTLTFILVIILYTLWNSNSIFLTATNRHTRLSLVYLLSSFIALVAGYFISNLQIIELTALSLSITEIACCLYSFSVTKHFIQTFKGSS